MNEKQAIAKLRKIVGPKLGYRVEHRAPDAAQREEIRARWNAAKKVADDAAAARKARYEELLAGDAQYQELKAKAEAAKKAQDAAAAGLLSYRVTIGRSTGMFFSVIAQGDNWDEVVAAAGKRVI